MPVNRAIASALHRPHVRRSYKTPRELPSPDFEFVLLHTSRSIVCKTHPQPGPYHDAATNAACSTVRQSALRAWEQQVWRAASAKKGFLPGLCVVQARRQMASSKRPGAQVAIQAIWWL